MRKKIWDLLGHNAIWAAISSGFSYIGGWPTLAATFVAFAAFLSQLSKWERAGLIGIGIYGLSLQFYLRRQINRVRIELAEIVKASEGRTMQKLADIEGRFAPNQSLDSNPKIPLIVTFSKEWMRREGNPRVEYCACKLAIFNADGIAAENLTVELTRIHPEPVQRITETNPFGYPKPPIELKRLDGGDQNLLNPGKTALFEFFSVPREGVPSKIQFQCFIPFLTENQPHEFTVEISSKSTKLRSIKYKVWPTVERNMPAFDIEEIR
jgi:hypothetical protein